MKQLPQSQVETIEERLTEIETHITNSEAQEAATKLYSLGWTLSNFNHLGYDTHQYDDTQIELYKEMKLLM